MIISCFVWVWHLVCHIKCGTLIWGCLRVRCWGRYLGLSGRKKEETGEDYITRTSMINHLNAELNPICHLLALLGGATIVVVSRLSVKQLTFPKLVKKIWSLKFHKRRHKSPLLARVTSKMNLVLKLCQFNTSFFNSTYIHKSRANVVNYRNYCHAYSHTVY